MAAASRPPDRGRAASSPPPIPLLFLIADTGGGHRAAAVAVADALEKAFPGRYAPTLFDYIRRAMPQNAPQSLSNADVYAVSAYILHLNGLLSADATLDARSLSAIKMPNRGMFTDDPRPDVKNPACVTGC